MRLWSHRIRGLDRPITTNLLGATCKGRAYSRGESNNTTFHTYIWGEAMGSSGSGRISDYPGTSQSGGTSSQGGAGWGGKTAAREPSIQCWRTSSTLTTTAYMARLRVRGRLSASSWA